MLSEACAQGEVIVLCMDQTDVAERFAVLMLSVRVGERALPLAWRIEAGEANIGWKRQREVLDQAKGWVPQGAQVMLLADRFYPSEKLFAWLHETGWHYRLRLKGSLTVDVGRRDIETTGDLAAGTTERCAPDARLFAAAVPTNIGVLHESGHDEAWIVAMNCPLRAAACWTTAYGGASNRCSPTSSRGASVWKKHRCSVQIDSIGCC